MSLLAFLRKGMSARLRKLTFGFLLLGGALGGMPMRPDEIEELMQKMSETRIVAIAERLDEAGDDKLKKYCSSTCENTGDSHHSSKRAPP